MSFARSCAVTGLSTALALASVAPAAAQTPGRLSDLVGARAGQAEGELGRRGYQVTDRSEVVGDGRLTYWRRGDECVAIMTRDGRYQSINQAGRSECGSEGSNHDHTAAVVAGVAIVGLAAAIAAHNRRHNDADRDHDSEYQRGYQAGLYGSPYDDRHETEGYHEGYLAGEARRPTAATPTPAGSAGRPGPPRTPARAAPTSIRTAPRARARRSAYATSGETSGS